MTILVFLNKTQIQKRLKYVIISRDVKNMIILVGASASGKTEISKVLFNNYHYKKCVTTTTRQIRVNEIEDVDYHFKTKEAFELLIKNDELIEHTIYQNEYYGIQKKDIMNNGVVILDPNGVNSVIKAYKDVIYVVLVEADKSHRFARMFGRKDKIETIYKRLETDDIIFSKENLNKIDLIITNNQEALDDLASQIHENYQLFLSKITKELK